MFNLKKIQSLEWKIKDLEHRSDIFAKRIQCLYDFFKLEAIEEMKAVKIKKCK